MRWLKIRWIVAASLGFLLPNTVLAADATPRSSLSSLIALADAKRLWDEVRWHRLIHYKRGMFGGIESEEDGLGFFLSPEGKHDPRAELIATLESFFKNPTDLAFEEEHPQCVFPARFKFVKSRLEIDAESLPIQPCPRLESWVADLDPERVTLVFASFYLNNPASMFGHTFLRIDKKREGPEQKLLNYGVNYAANVDTNNALVYAFKGIFGYFRGTFTLFPYFTKIQEYSNFESRDLWEYELDFTEDQTNYLLLHLWELGENYFDYYYFQENCSYHILSLLEVANPDLRLTDRFLFQVIPSETIKVVTQQEGLVFRRVYRPSVLSQMNQRLLGMGIDEKRALTRVIRKPTEVESPAFQTLPVGGRIAVLDAALDFTQYLAMQANADENEFNREARPILMARARTGRLESERVDRPELSSPPELGHGSNQISLGYGGFGRERYGQASIRPAYHDIMARDVGYNRYSQILFFETTGRYYRDLEAWRLESFKPLDIVSLTPFDPLFKKLSWQLGVEVGTIRDVPCEFCNALSAQYGVGLSFSPTPLAPFLVYGLANVKAEWSGHLEKNGRLGGGGTGGIILDVTDAWRIQLSADYLNFPIGHDSDYYRLSFVQRFAPSQNVDFRLHLGRFKGKNDWLATGNLYF